MWDIGELVGKLGPIAWGVIATLALMSVMSASIAIERYRTYRRAVSSSRALARETAALLKAGRLREAAERCRSAQARHSHVASTLGAGIEEWLACMARGTGEAAREAAAISAKEAASQMAALELSDLRRGLVVLATIGSTAPFVGLFGTTFGIIDAFKSIAFTGSGGITAVSSGIAEALLTTALGLLVAVPAVWAYNYFSGRLERMAVEMERSGYELAAFLGKQVQ